MFPVALEIISGVRRAKANPGSIDVVTKSLILSPDRGLALYYAPAHARPALTALLALDDTLGRILRGAREPMLAQMRLTWWAQALERLDREPPPAEPVLSALAADVLPNGVSGASLAAMVDGWEAILGEEALRDEALATFAEKRGGTLFRAMAAVCDAADRHAGEAGEGWALADLARNLSDTAAADRARVLAITRLGRAVGIGWSRRGRALGALALLARFELEGRSGVGRIGRLLFHKLTGR